MKHTVFVVAVTVVCTAMPLAAQSTRITFVHTNDLHSHLLGYAPTFDYRPEAAVHDGTQGGFSRIKAIIDRVKATRSNPVLVVDAGDFLMGSLFHMVSRERAIELRLMKEMGYAAVTLGNHEFDLKPKGLSRIIRSAARYGGLPPIVASNVVFSKTDPRDDELEAVFSEGLVTPYRIIDVGGISIGFLGLIGKDAAEVSPFAKPVTFADPVAAAKRTVAELRGKKVDLVVCLSHCGINMDDVSKSEDVRLAREVPGIDLIIGGHTHTLLRKPLREGKTVIVQADSYGRGVGVLDIELRGGAVTLADYRIETVDGSVAGDPVMNRKIDGFKREVGEAVLGPLGLGHDSVVAETSFDLTIGETESNLGNLLTDAVRCYLNRLLRTDEDPEARIVVAIESNGLIRDPVKKGKTGKITAADLFAAFPLGIGKDDTMGYPLVTTYLYAHEIKKALEILTSVYPLKGDDYFLQVSGLRFVYNPRRVIFDRVTDIWIGDEEKGFERLDYSQSNRRLYRVAANMYNAAFLGIIGDFTFGILTIVPKDRNGRPMKDVTEGLVDADPARPGVQEVKEWEAILTYVRNLPDRNGNGIPDIPPRYRSPEGRIVRAPSLNPYHLLRGGTWVTYTAAGTGLAVASVIAAAVFFVIRRRKKIG